MIDGPFRSLLPRFTKPIIRAYSRLGVTPNQLTALAFAVSGLSAWLILQQQFLAAVGVWWLGRLLDGTDGIYARATQQTSLLGAHLDIVSDMASYSLMILAMSSVFREQQPLWIAIMFCYVLCITGALSLGILEKEKGIAVNDNRGLRLAAGFAEGGETGIAYTVFLLWPQYLTFTLWIWLAILLLTVVTRLILATRILGDKG